MLQFFDTLTDDSGNSLLGATVTVTNYPSGSLASIYQTNGTAQPIANSAVAADITGQVSFYIPDGPYTLTYAYKSTVYKVRSPVQLADPLALVVFQETGAANAYVLTTPALTAQLYTGLKLEFKATATNTGPSTLNLNGVGAIAINQPGGSALAAGMIQAGGLTRVEYDGVQFQLIGSQSQPFYAITQPENNAALVIINGSYLPGQIDRYGNNTVPGTTDMSVALQAAVSQNLQPGGAPVRIGSNAYSIVTPPTFGGVTNTMLRLDIGGAGDESQLINNAPAGTAYLFNMSGKNGWYMHDFLICGNSVHKNGGISAGVTGGAEQIRWRIERVTAMMAGVGLRIADTNNGAVKGYRSWPNNPPALIVAQAVTNGDIDHHIYLTGGFVNAVAITDCDCLPSAVYKAGQRGIKADCAASYGVTIIGGDYESNSGANTETGIDFAITGGCGALTILGVYHEGTIISLTNVADSKIGPLTNGAVGGSLVLVTGVSRNLFVGIQVAVYNNQDPSNLGNLFVGMIATTSWTDSADAPNQSNLPNRYLGCFAVSKYVADRGAKWRRLLTYSASISPDTYDANTNVIRVNNGTAFTINVVAHPYNGQEVEFVIRNESGGALGAMTVNGLNGGLVGWTPPANGKNRAFCIYYDSDFAAWYQKWVGSVDVTN